MSMTVSTTRKKALYWSYLQIVGLVLSVRLCLIFCGYWLVIVRYKMGRVLLTYNPFIPFIAVDIVNICLFIHML